MYKIGMPDTSGNSNNFDNKLNRLNIHWQNKLQREAYIVRDSFLEQVNDLFALALEDDIKAKDGVFIKWAEPEDELANDAYGQNYAITLKFEATNTEEDNSKESLMIYMPISSSFYNAYYSNEDLQGNPINDDTIFVELLKSEKPEAVIVQRITCENSLENSDIRRITVGGSVNYKLFGGETAEEAEQSLEVFLEHIANPAEHIFNESDGDPNTPLWLYKTSEKNDIDYINQLRIDISNKFQPVKQAYIKFNTNE
jgi:hypothetical protein